MSDSHDHVLATLASGYDRASDVASVICGLIKKGVALGELVERQYLDRGEILVERIPPADWFDRLSRAIDVRAFDRLTVDEIVDRILMPIEPSAGA